MTATYTLATLSSTPKDQIRLLVGDTDMTAAMLQDEEITYLLTLFKSVYAVSAMACRTLAGKYSRLADQAQGVVRTSHSQKAKAFLALAIKYDMLGKTAGAPPAYAGGISISDKMVQENDTDRIPPPFTVCMDDNLFLPVAPDESGQTLTGLEGVV